jgi:hypothetical protein
MKAQPIEDSRPLMPYTAASSEWQTIEGNGREALSKADKKIIKRMRAARKAGRGR